MESTAAIDIRALINQQTLSSYQKRIIAMSFAVVAMDGMDIAMMGFIAPALKSAWG